MNHLKNYSVVTGAYWSFMLTGGDKAAVNVGFYYMANAGGRFVKTLLSGLLYQIGGISYCLIGAALLNFKLPRATQAAQCCEVT